MTKFTFRRTAAILTIATACTWTAMAADEKADAKQKDTTLPDPVAIVEGEKISRADLEQAFNSALASAGINPSDLSADQKISGYRDILDEMIVDKLISRKASSVKLPEADIEAEVKKVKAQFPSEEVFKAEMKKAGETEATFRDTVKKMLQQQKWMEAQLGDKVKVTESDVKKFYDDNKKEFEHPELVSARHILILTPEDADDKVIAEKKKAADAALKRVTSGKEDFETVAKEVSEEPGAKESGGNLGFFPKDRMVPEFANAAFALKKGEISKEPVRTKFGWHIIQVTDHKDAGTMAFDDVKEQVAGFIEGAKRREAISGILDSVRAEAKVENKLPPAPPAPAAPASPHAHSH